jgi:hypothetical protein
MACEPVIQSEIKFRGTAVTIIPLDCDAICESDSRLCHCSVRLPLFARACCQSATVSHSTAIAHDMLPELLACDCSVCSAIAIFTSQTVAPLSAPLLFVRYREQSWRYCAVVDGKSFAIADSHLNWAVVGELYCTAGPEFPADDQSPVLPELHVNYRHNQCRCQAQLFEYFTDPSLFLSRPPGGQRIHQRCTDQEPSVLTINPVLPELHALTST